MRSISSLIIVLLALSACRQTEKTTASIDYIIELDSLQKIINQPHVKLIDFRKPKQYADGHISGAINIWRSDIEDHTYPYKGMIAQKKTLEKLFSSLGIDNNDLLIVYDDNGLCDAARFWWVLQQYGYTSVRLLNGAYSSWKNQVKTITTTRPTYPTTTFLFKNTPSFHTYINKESLKPLLHKATIVDTRNPDEFSGKRQKKGAYRAGRIPSSISIDWKNAIYYKSDKRIKPVKELEKIYLDQLPSKKTPIIVYCHTGVRSAHTIFVLTQLLGYENVKNYDGSWSEWSYFNDLPFEKDSITTILK